jgi:hypothetical protein
MTSMLPSAPVDISTLQRGDRVAALSPQGHISLLGEVDDLAPEFDVVWVRDERTGERKLCVGADGNIHLQATLNRTTS